MKKTIILCIACLTVSGCAASHVTSYESRQEERRVSSVKVPSMSVLPTLADLDINQSRSSTVIRRQAPYNLESMMVVALSSLQWKTGADLIIEPRYSVSEKNGLAVVTVTGYPAHYRNLRMLSTDDVRLMQAFKKAPVAKSKKIKTYSQTLVEVETVPAPKAQPAKSGLALTLGFVSCEDSDDEKCKADTDDAPELEGTVALGVSYRKYLNTHFGVSVDADYSMLSQDAESSGFSAPEFERTVNHFGLYAMARANYTVNDLALGAGFGFGYSAFFRALKISDDRIDAEYNFSSTQSGLGRKFTLTAYYPVAKTVSVGVEWVSLTQSESEEEWDGDDDNPFKPENIEYEPINLNKFTLGVQFHL